MLEKIKARIEKLLSARYIRPDGIFEGSYAAGYVEYNSERGDHDVIIDGKPFTWEQLGQNVAVHDGWNIKIEFTCSDEELD